MKKWTLLISLMGLFLVNIAWAENNSKETQAVIEKWFAAMKDKQIDTAASYLAPQFVSIHTDGLVRNKTQEIQLIKDLHMQSYHLSHFKFSPSGDVMTVTFIDDSREKIDNKPITAKPAGRMAVLQKQNTKWTIIAYANLDTIG